LSWSANLMASAMILHGTTRGAAEKIDVSGVYPDPDGACEISGKAVDIVVRDNNSTGTIRKAFTSGPTTASGALRTHYDAQRSSRTRYVLGSGLGPRSLAGGYGAGDVCPDVSNNNAIVLT
jgi:hypothetical protein